jgi:hypothetical protein
VIVGKGIKQDEDSRRQRSCHSIWKPHVFSVILAHSNTNTTKNNVSWHLPTLCNVNLDCKMAKCELGKCIIVSLKFSWVPVFFMRMAENNPLKAENNLTSLCISSKHLYKYLISWLTVHFKRIFDKLVFIQGRRWREGSRGWPVWA